jgi:GT2 family glycosyltransferase
MTVTVVVCAYTDERWEHIVAALDSVAAQSTPATETILVIDHNRLLYERCIEWFRGVTVLENQGERGLSDARNTGVAAATSEIVAFLDDDAVADRRWLETLVAAYDDPTVIAAGGRALPEWETGRPDWFPEEFDWIVGCTHRGHRTTPGPIRNVIGCNMTFRREAIAAAGGFRNTLGRVGTRPVGGEETELSIRATRTVEGGIVRYEPDAEISHHVPAGRATWSYFRRRCYSEGLSKALIARLVGSGDALSSERAYTFAVLPAGVIRGIVDAIIGRRPGGLRRAAAIVAGLLLTTAGYAAGRIRLLASRPDPTLDSDIDYSPTSVIHLEISQRLPSILGPDDADGPRRIAAWVRWSGTPVGMFVAPLPAGGLSPSDLSRMLWTQLGAELQRHAESIGIEDLAELGPEGYAASPKPAPAAPVAGPLVSVVIATRDRPSQLIRCLQSVAGLDYPNLDVVVVDNAPATGATARIVASDEFADMGITYVLEPIPGLANAHNRGVEVARGEILAFTDDDVEVDRSWVTRIVAAFEDPKVGCVTGMIVPMALDTRGQWWLECYAGFSKGFERRYFDMNGHRPEDQLYPFTAGRLGSGANMAFRADVLAEIGGFDPALGAGSPAFGGDDLAAFFEVVSNGYGLVYEPAAIVNHEHRKDEDALRNQVFGYGAGLTAFLTSAIAAKPARLLQMLRRLPRGLRYALSAKSEKNERQANDFPKRLRRREQLGMLFGPLAYVRSRRRWRREA